MIRAYSECVTSKQAAEWRLLLPNPDCSLLLLLLSSLPLPVHLPHRSPANSPRVSIENAGRTRCAACLPVCDGATCAPEKFAAAAQSRSVIPAGARAVGIIRRVSPQEYSCSFKQITPFLTFLLVFFPSSQVEYLCPLSPPFFFSASFLPGFSARGEILPQGRNDRSFRSWLAIRMD